jgi:hypothetical protein
MSILFDEDIYKLSMKKEKLKTCFVDSFRFTTFGNRTGDLEIPLREFIQVIPQDFFFYRGSLTEPPCTEQTSWVVFKNPQVITTSQMETLRSLLPTEGNARNIQELNKRNSTLTESEVENGDRPREKRVVYLGGSQQIQSRFSSATKVMISSVLATTGLLMLLF